MGRGSCRCHYSLFNSSPVHLENRTSRGLFRVPRTHCSRQGFGLFGPRISRVLLHDHPSIIPASFDALYVDGSNGQGNPRIPLGSRSCRSGIASTGIIPEIRGNSLLSLRLTIMLHNNNSNFSISSSRLQRRGARSGSRFSTVQGRQSFLEAKESVGRDQHGRMGIGIDQPSRGPLAPIISYR